MRWTDLLHPDRLFDAFVKLFLGLITLLFFICWLASALRSLNGAAVLLCMAAVSVVAYLIRKASWAHPERPGARRGAERTPLLPANEEDQ